MKRVLFVATVVKTHIVPFHLPYLKLFKDCGWETAVAAKNDYFSNDACVIPYCDKYYDIPIERSPFRVSNIKAFIQLKRIIEDGNFDIIHCHTPVGALLARLAAYGVRKWGTKVIYTAHGFHFFTGAPLHNWLIYFPIEWCLAKITDFLITINSEDYCRAKRCITRRVTYVDGVGVDTQRFRSLPEDKGMLRSMTRQEWVIPEDAIVLLSVGELTRRKNHRVIIEALSKIQNKMVYYVICGSGPLLDTLRDYANELGVGTRVILTSYCDDIERYYTMSDIFVFPSRQEGLPVAVIEAMASGLPVICSKIRGCTDLITDELNGFLIDENDVGAYVDAISRLMDRETRVKIGLSNKEAVVKYDLHNVIEQYRKIYMLEEA